MEEAEYQTFPVLCGEGLSRVQNAAAHPFRGVTSHWSSELLTAISSLLLVPLPWKTPLAAGTLGENKQGDT